MLNFNIKAEPIGREGNNLIVVDEHGNHHQIRQPEVTNIDNDIIVNDIYVRAQVPMENKKPIRFFNYNFTMDIKFRDCSVYYIMECFHESKNPSPPYLNFLPREFITSQDIAIDSIKVGMVKTSPQTLIENNTPILQGQSVEIKCRSLIENHPDGQLTISGIAWYGPSKYKSLFKKE